MKIIELYTAAKPEKLVKKLNQQIPTQILSTEYIIKSYYDSFDWRLYKHQLVAEQIRSKQQSRFLLRSLDSENLIAETDLKDIPKFSQQFENQEIANILEPILKIRALTKICTIDYDRYLIAINDENGELIAKLTFEQYELFGNRLLLEAAPNQNKKLGQIIKILNKEFTISTSKESVFSKALKSQGRKPKDYSAKLHLQLAKSQRADLACQSIYSQLLKTIKNNEHGVINATDTEFLHDFRTAAHRTQTGLRQLDNVFPESDQDYFLKFFDWLAEISNESRDLDVHLLSFQQQYQADSAKDKKLLATFHSFLSTQQQHSQKQLADLLKSAEYLTGLHEWERFLARNIDKGEPIKHAKTAIKKLADKRLKKIYLKFLVQGFECLKTESDSSLHELRKLIRKLRYLCEFFASLYPENKITSLLSDLKQVQNLLGLEHDLSIQISHWNAFQEQHKNKTDALIIKSMVANLNTNKQKIIQEFSVLFTEFSSIKNQKMVDNLFN
jgi:CHAD domain-containing protein